MLVLKEEMFWKYGKTFKLVLLVLVFSNTSTQRALSNELTLPCIYYINSYIYISLELHISLRSTAMTAQYSDMSYIVEKTLSWQSIKVSSKRLFFFPCNNEYLTIMKSQALIVL